MDFDKSDKVLDWFELVRVADCLLSFCKRLLNVLTSVNSVAEVALQVFAFANRSLRKVSIEDLSADFLQSRWRSVSRCQVALWLLELHQDPLGVQTLLT